MSRFNISVAGVTWVILWLLMTVPPHYAPIIHQYRFPTAMGLLLQARSPAVLHQSVVKTTAAAKIIPFLVVSDRMSLPELFKLVEVAETLLVVVVVCCDCVNGTGGNFSV